MGRFDGEDGGMGQVRAKVINFLIKYKNMENKNFEDFKNLYEVRKTIRFELKPSKKTLEKLNMLEVFKKPKANNFLIYSGSAVEINWEKVEKFIVDIKIFLSRFSSLIDFFDGRDCNFEKIYIYSEMIRLCGAEGRDLYQKNFSKKSYWENNANKKIEIYYKINDSFSINAFDSKFNRLINCDERGEISNAISNNLHKYQNALETNLSKLKEEIIQQKKCKDFTNEYLFGKINIICDTLEKTCKILSFVNINKSFDEKFLSIFKELPIKNAEKNLKDIQEELRCYNNKNAIRKYTFNLRGAFPRVLDSSKEKTDYSKTESEILEEIMNCERDLQEIKNKKSILKAERSKIKNKIAAKITEIANTSVIPIKNDAQKIWNNKDIIKIDLGKCPPLNGNEFVFNVLENVSVQQFKKSSEKENICEKNRSLFENVTKLISESHALKENLGRKNFLEIHEEFNKKNKEFQNFSSKINRLRKDLENVRITHFGKIINKENKYFLLLENVFDQERKKKRLDQFLLNNLPINNGDCKLLNYQSLTFNALRKLCLEKDGTVFAGYLKDKYGNFISKNENGDITKQKDEKIKVIWKEFLSNKDGFTQTDFNIFKSKLKGTLLNPCNNFGFNFDREILNNIFYGSHDMENLIINIDESFYCLYWQDCNFDNLKILEKENKIEIYQIYNKDFKLDEAFAISENDKNKVENQKKQNKNGKYKANLFTMYWNNFFSQLAENNFSCPKIRLNPEGKFYVKLAIEQDKKTEAIKSKKLEHRKSQNKIYGDFELSFNAVSPLNDEERKKIRDVSTKKEPNERIGLFNQYINKKINSEEYYVIGIDRGENSLVAYTLVKFRKKIIEDSDIKVRFSCQNGHEGWVVDEIVEYGDLSAVKVFNEKGKWMSNKFIEQKDDNYFYSKNESNQYDETKNLEEGVLRQKQSGSEFILLPIRDNNREKSGAYSLKRISWKEADGCIYNYRVAQESLKERRLKVLKENKNEDMKLQSTEEFKNGYVSTLVGFLAEKVKEYGAFISLENLNQEIKGKIIKDDNLEKTFGTSVYQIIENRLMSKFGYLVLKNNPEECAQITPKVRRIEDLKKDIYAENEKNKDYQLGFVQITDESNTSKICPNCGYSKSKCENPKIENETLKMTVVNEKGDFGLDKKKKIEFEIKESERAYKYTEDGVETLEFNPNDKDFVGAICYTRQNKTKQKDFIRCVYCGFDSRFPDKNHKKLKAVNSGDTLAAYNIAKRGLEFILKQKDQ